jgi:ribosome-associated protein
MSRRTRDSVEIWQEADAGSATDPENDRVDADGYAIRTNKSQRKRELAAVAELVQQLSQLSDGELSEAPLAADLREALALYRRMKPSAARQRQLRFLTGRLDGSPAQALQEWFAVIELARQQQAHRFHLVEGWRDRLIAEGDPALAEFIAEIPDCDRQQLRQAVRDARRERDTGKPAGAGRKLFRQLRVLLDP